MLLCLQKFSRARILTCFHILIFSSTIVWSIFSFSKCRTKSNVYSNSIVECSIESILSIDPYSANNATWKDQRQRTEIIFKQGNFIWYLTLNHLDKGPFQQYVTLLDTFLTHPLTHVALKNRFKHMYRLWTTKPWIGSLKAWSCSQA